MDPVWTRHVTVNHWWDPGWTQPGPGRVWMPGPRVHALPRLPSTESTEADDHTRLLVAFGDGAGPSAELAGLARCPETAELARDRKRRSWKGFGNSGAGTGSETADSAGVRRQRISSGAQRRRRWSRLEDGGAEQGSKTAELAPGPETAELARARRWLISSGAKRRRSWLGL